MAGDLLTLVRTSSCTGRRDAAACEGGVWVCCIVFHHTASESPPVVWLVSFIAKPLPGRYDEITGSCCVARQERQPNSPGKRQNGCRPHRSTTVLCCVWWETNELRRVGEGSIKGHQIFICHTAPSPRLYPHSIVWQTTKKTAPQKQQQHSEGPAETEEAAKYVWLTPGSPADEREQFTNHLTHRWQASLT